jgi:hypothetical protein
LQTFFAVHFFARRGLFRPLFNLFQSWQQLSRSFGRADMRRIWHDGGQALHQEDSQ